MKLKKLIISASAVAAGSGLLATVLTSCSKADIDDDLKIELNDEGKFADQIDGLDYKQAVKSALSRSASWTQFKEALAEEVVYQWYVNRASKDKNDDKKNTTFRSNLDEWKYQIDKEYDDTVDNLKSKYGANYKFYLQNEQLAPNGGTEEAYKHAKLVDKVKTKFIDDAFATIYFGRATGTLSTKYPHIFTKATNEVDELTLNDPEVWAELGFFAKTYGGFSPKDTDYEDYLAKNPAGDYATLQDYVFNRWFKTEKPFFSAASLFKYSKPNSQSADKKLSDVYNGALTTIPDDPNEAFPFFGGVAKDEVKGTKAFYQWYQTLKNDGFESGGLYWDEDQDKYVPNGTITIPSNLTEDSQTLLLSYGSKMIGGSDGALYIPYAISAASLYSQMFGLPTTAAVKNTITQKQLEANVGATVPTYLDDFRILSNFFYKGEYGAVVEKARHLQAPDYIKSYIDLNSIYGGLTTRTEGSGETAVTYDVYNCPLFRTDCNYKYFVGNESGSTPIEWTGVRYITNNVQVELGKDVVGSATQPWVLELNEAGMHAQTIDGYKYVTDKTTGLEPQEALKNVIKYRLMQKKCGYNDKLISADLFDSNGKLKTYFTDNFANIVLEMAMDHTTTDNHNIFRTIETYEDNRNDDEDDDTYLLYVACKDQALQVCYENLKTYLTAAIDYERIKKQYDAVVAADEKIYAYRKDQIANAKDSPELDSKIYENGVIAPIALEFVYSGDYDTTHHYSIADQVIYYDWDVPGFEPTKAIVKLALSYVTDSDFVTQDIDNYIKTNDQTFAFNPQISAAKDAMSNRFWYQSWMVDKMMYGYMGGTETANYIKTDTYKQYWPKVLTNGFDIGVLTNSSLNGQLSTYFANKFLSGDKNIASYTDDAAALFFYVMNEQYERWGTDTPILNGEYCDDLTNYAMYKTTLAYLARDNFKNFYSTLNSRIANDESAFFGYITKYDTANSAYEQYAATPVVFGDEYFNGFYKWQANVDNIFDETGYAGGEPGSIVTDGKISYDQYNHVVLKNSVEVGGFTGLQTKRTNQIDEDSGLKTAAFDKLAKATVGSKDIVLGGTAHAQNDGALFQWAGQYKDASQTEEAEYKFTDVEDPTDEGGETVTSTWFHDNLPNALKLATSIANAGTLQDLKDIAASLGSAIYGYSIFTDIGQGTYPLEDEYDYVAQLKWIMLNELKTGNYGHMFKRLRNVELHTSDGGTKYCFEHGSNGYKLFLTQINKADVIEQRIAPKYENNKWVMPQDEAGTYMDLDEFWYIFCQLATESSIQQYAIADAVKEIYGDEKLKVYDAQLYNQFDSIWIKDWVKKPLGGE